MRKTRLPAALLTLTLTLPFAAGCGLLGSPDDPRKAPPGAPVELSSIRVTLCCGALDVAPFYLAHDRGYFADEGITKIDIATVGNGAAAVDSIISGDTQIAFSSYTPFIAAQSKGAADLKLVADASSLAENNTNLVVMPHSFIEKVNDLGGKRVAVTATNTMAHYLAQSALEVNNIDLSTVEWVSLGFKDMLPALQRGDIDAALLTEPFLTTALYTLGATGLYDVSQGPTEDMPIGGYGALAEFAADNPRTIAAFQRALARAVHDAIADVRVLREIILDYGKVDKTYVDLFLGHCDFQTSLDKKRIQRVADLMGQFGAFNERFDVSDMIVPPAKPK